MVFTEKMWWPIKKKMQFCEKWVLSYLVRIDWLKLSRTIDPAIIIISKPSVRLAADVQPLHKTSKTHQSLLPQMWLTLFIQTKKHQQKTFTKLQLLLPSVQLIFAPNFQIFSIHTPTLSCNLTRSWPIQVFSKLATTICNREDYCTVPAWPRHS